MGKDPTKPGRNCQQKHNSLLVVTSPPARETSAMSSLQNSLYLPLHVTAQVRYLNALPDTFYAMICNNGT